jgi:hypothetical protein
MIDASGDQLRASVELCANAVDPGGELPGQAPSGCPHGLACLMAGCSGIAAALLPGHLEFGSDFARTTVLALRSVDRIALPAGLPHSARAPPHV